MHKRPKLLLLTATFLLASFVFTPPAFASSLDCENRFATLVNPVRGRSLWIDSSLKPIRDQYSAVNKNHFAATWLLQYDTLGDEELLQTIRQFDQKQEKGVFLEVSETLAKDARVLYPQQTPWYKPNAVFLSGYSRTERKWLIDTLFRQFKQVWGYYPKSVGAWWIDSYSLQYIKQKYNITSAMIVADQLSTDGYGVWGQWWGVPYYGSKANILTPASSIYNKMPVTVIQWAQRHPLKAYGDTKSFSNYSVQANDYISLGLTTDHFKEVTSSYLDCSNRVGQVTVGLETGQESVPYIDEYNRQLSYLKSIPNLKVVNMSDFAIAYQNTYPKFPISSQINYKSSSWKMDTTGRSNQVLNDQVSYNQNVSFRDYFVATKDEFLDRKLPLQNQDSSYFPLWILAALAGIFFYLRRKLPEVGIIGFLVALSSYGLILRSFYLHGWKVFFGPVVEYLVITQVVLLLLGFIWGFVWWKIFKLLKIKEGILIMLSFLVYGLDLVIGGIRYTKLDGVTYLGFLVDPFRFIGISFGSEIKFANQDFSAHIAGALLKINLAKIWESPLNWLVIYPIIHLVAALILLLIMRKLAKGINILIISLLGVLWLAFMLLILMSDPLQVKPSTHSGLPGLLQ